MQLQVSKAWQLGLLLLLLNVIISEVSLIFDGYVYARIGIDRSYLSLVLWLFPLAAAYIASRYSSQYKVVFGLSYMLLFPLIATVGHYINGEFGGAVDFVGKAGIVVFFKIHFVISAIIIVIGTILGVAFSEKKGTTESKKST